MAFPKRPAESPDRPSFYSVAEAARILGTSTMTLYRAIADQEFPAVRIRGRLIVPVRAVESMIESAMATSGVVDSADWTQSGGRS